MEPYREGMTPIFLMEQFYQMCYTMSTMKTPPTALPLAAALAVLAATALPAARAESAESAAPAALAAVQAASAAAFGKPDATTLAWFPAEVREAAPSAAARFDLAPGVEYGYVYCQSLFGHPGDIHAVRIDLEKAALRPHIDEGALHQDKKQRLSTTSAAAAAHQALFSINGGFFKWEELIPYYRMKIDGQILPSHAGGTMGLAFSNDGKRVKLGRVKDDELAQWDNFIAGEGIVSGGKCCLDWKRPEGVKTKPQAPRTLLGMDAEGRHLWVVVTGGRKTGNLPSMGLTYIDAADLLVWFGCAEGVNLDGGGSTTLVVRKDALEAAGDPATPEAHPAAAEGYVILNCTSDGKERAVLDHLQFWDARSK